MSFLSTRSSFVIFFFSRVESDPNPKALGQQFSFLTAEISRIFLVHQYLDIQYSFYAQNAIISKHPTEYKKLYVYIKDKRRRRVPFSHFSHEYLIRPVSLQNAQDSLKINTKFDYRLCVRFTDEEKLRGVSLDLHLYWHARICAKHMIFIDNACVKEQDIT